MDFTILNKLQAKLKKIRPLNQAEIQRLRDEFAIENTYNSNAIEGNSLTLRETAIIIKEGITVAGKHIREHLEVIGHKQAFDYIVELADNSSVLTEKNIKDIHSLVLMDNRVHSGVYRKVPVRILGAVHSTTEPSLIQQEMSQLISDYPNRLNSAKHAIEAIAEFHLRFEGIHPFIDGNGRVGRLIINLELIKAGLLPVNIKFSDRLAYYECFDAYYGEKKSTDNLVKLITSYQIEELEKYISIIEGK